MFTTLQRTKQHINVDPEYTEDDNYIISLVQAAESAVSKRLNLKSLGELMTDEGYLPEDVTHAVLFIVGLWYMNREPVTNLAANKVPMTAEFLFELNKNYRSIF